MKMPKLVSNWKEAWKWNSMQALTFIAALPLIWVQLPPEAHAFLSGLIPEQYHPLIITLVASVGAVLRLRDQSGGRQ